MTCADFFRGEDGAVRAVADRMVGSPEVYGHKEREAEQSVNFVTCHDGFTLNDLVSYNRNTTKPTAKRIVTARTTTEAGIAASRGRRMTRRWKNCEISR